MMTYFPLLTNLFKPKTVIEMNAPEQLKEQIKAKAKELGIAEHFIFCALDILHQNRDLVNAIDNRTEMDEYIYRAIIKDAMEKRKRSAEADAESDHESIRLQAEKDLAMLSREELITDPYYRAVLPTITKIVVNEPVLRLHADEAAAIVIELADFKRRNRATSVTEIIVTRFNAEMESLNKLSGTSVTF